MTVRQCSRRGEVIGVRSGLYGRGFACRGLLSGKGWLKRCLGASVFGKHFSNDVVVSALTGEGAFVDFLLAPSVVNEFNGGNGVSALLEGSDFCRHRGCCAVNKESLKMVRDGDRREEEFPRGVYSSRWAIRWVVLTGDKSCMGRDEIGGAFSQEGMDALEHVINEFVPVSAHFPAFNDTGVVAIDGDML